MWQHIRKEHPELIDWGDLECEKPPNEAFEFTVTGEYKDPLSRQLTELVLIRMAKNNRVIKCGRGQVGNIKIKESLNTHEERFVPFVRKISPKNID